MGITWIQARNLVEFGAEASSGRCGEQIERMRLYETELYRPGNIANISSFADTYPTCESSSLGLSPFLQSGALTVRRLIERTRKITRRTKQLLFESPL